MLLDKFGPDDLLQFFYHYKARKELKYKQMASCFVRFDDGEIHPFAEEEFAQLDDYEPYEEVAARY